MYYRGCDGVFLVVDTSRNECLTNVNDWLAQIREQGPSHMVIMLLATKIDLEPAIDIDVLRQFADREGLLFAACSAKTAEGVDDAVIQLTSAMMGLTDVPDIGFSWDGIAQAVGEAKTDSNLLNVDVPSLADEVTTATGEPCMCSNCGVLLNSLSTVTLGHRTSNAPSGVSDAALPCVQAPAIAPELQHIEDGAGHVDDLSSGPYRIWDCEFCGRRNLLDVDEDELPREDVVDYVVRAPSSTGNNPRSVVFCLGMLSLSWLCQKQCVWAAPLDE